MLAKKHNLSPRYLRRRKSQSGQSVIIALAILFLLGFLGALFSLIVVRNLTNAQDQNNTLTTDYFAQAGINYANTQLETSPEGADWRPPLQYQYTPGTAPSYILTGSAAYQALPTAASLDPNPPTGDPDAKWLAAGFTRYNLNGGRFLIRLDYDPSAAANASPTAKYIEIESIGRLGTIDPNDPTTYSTSPPDYRRSELVAFKPIGIVDYSRFITNKDNRTDTATLGVPSVAVGTSPSISVVTPGVEDFSTGSTTPTEYPLTTTYGSISAYTGLASTGTAGGGGSLRSNMNLRLYGENNVYLNTLVGDDWEVAGNITLDNYNASSASASYNQEPAQCDVYLPQSSATAVTAAFNTMPESLYPSNDTVNGFNTLGGTVRDGNSGNDSYGYPRATRRLNPPQIDAVDAATGLTRYQTLCDGAELHAQQWSNASGDFTPATVSINNTADIQSESPNAVGGSSLRDYWLNTSAAGWSQGFYSPPGATVTFGPVPPVSQSANTATTPFGITITRSDTENGTAANFTGGSPSQNVGQTLYLSYAAAPTGTTANPTTSALGYLDVNEGTTTLSGGTVTPPNDVVIYASGNVRVRGEISNPAGTTAQHVTIVTNGIAYIDGSILKGNNRSSISILARQYVCVNTSQFLAGAPSFSNSTSTQAATGGPLTFTTSDVITESALFGTPYSGAATSTYGLYLSQSSAATSDTSQGDIGIDGSQLKPPAAVGNTPQNTVFTLGAGPPPIAYPFDMTFNKDAQYSADWIVQSAAILPADIHIEAVLYAQDDSFFVIPGNWFNYNPSDTLDKYATHANTTYDPNGDFPFYGQPIDMQVTIDGAISENIPANIADQAAWMQKWGWIPRYHGSDFAAGVTRHAPTTSVGVGLNISYDYNAGFPYSASGNTWLRQDRFGRPLPFAPALPVSPDLLYSGQPPT